jgi:hypothetical protein
MKVSVAEITQELFQRLWDNYLERVQYAKKYEELVRQNEGKVVIDHIAFRTLNTHTGEQPEGIRAIRHIMLALGYSLVEKYQFPKTNLSAVHFEHPNEMLPKIFVSQIEVELLPQWAQRIIHKTVKDTPYMLSYEGLELLQLLKTEGFLPSEAAEILIADLVKYFRRPWKIPVKEDVLNMNDISQYAAWVMLHGNSVNHFSACINQHSVSEWPDLITTYKSLTEAGIPLKDKIEGEPGSKLQQTATLAVKEEVVVRTSNGIETMPWTYAYFEMVQRGFIEMDGKQKLFNGFLNEQEYSLFEMTKTRDN